ncbi:MAG: CHAT domain-containing protein, partial [Planctomycetota bacterium]
GYVVALSRKDQQLLELSVDENLAETLGGEVGPLTAQRIGDLLSSDEQGLLALMRQKGIDEPSERKLAALSQALLPGGLLGRLTDGSIKRLLVVPDGPLALLPFETLVVETDPRASYLLDEGPPIVYGPSTTVMLNLKRRIERSAPAPTPVLTVGNPTYDAPVDDATLLAGVSAGVRYVASGGQLTPLPYSGLEAKWVEDVFQKQGVASLRLDGRQATEAQVRAAVGDKEIVHLACHGLVDKTYGNFFGSLALAPGADLRNPADDGFLTLPEIYDLDLNRCELTILSACDTNFGPQQTGEGVWSLSRGFLVAGSRRVVASSWLVDDQAAASIMSVFCSGIAKAKQEGEQPDYAVALQNAKRWARKQDKWKSPYFWGTFVLVGPE